MIRHDDPSTWVNPTPVSFAEARPYVAAMIGKPLEVTEDVDIWEFRAGKIKEDEYRDDPFTDDAVQEWYRKRGKDWNPNQQPEPDWGDA